MAEEEEVFLEAIEEKEKPEPSVKVPEKKRFFKRKPLPKDIKKDISEQVKMELMYHRLKELQIMLKEASDMVGKWKKELKK